MTIRSVLRVGARWLGTVAVAACAGGCISQESTRIRVDIVEGDSISGSPTADIAMTFRGLGFSDPPDPKHRASSDSMAYAEFLGILRVDSLLAAPESDSTRQRGWRVRSSTLWTDRERLNGEIRYQANACCWFLDEKGETLAWLSVDSLGYYINSSNRPAGAAKRLKDGRWLIPRTAKHLEIEERTEGMVWYQAEFAAWYRSYAASKARSDTLGPPQPAGGG